MEGKPRENNLIHEQYNQAFTKKNILGKRLVLLSILLGIWGISVYPMLLIFRTYYIPLSFQIISMIRITQIISSIIAIGFGVIAITQKNRRGYVGILLGVFGLLPIVWLLFSPPLLYE